MSKSKEVATQATTQPASIQSALLEIVQRDDIDPDRLEKFLDLQIKMEDRQLEKEFHLALSGFQMECPIIKKTKHVSFKSVDYWYAPLDEMVSVIKPILNKFGLSYTFNMFELQGKEYAELVTTIHHVNGYKKSYKYHFDPVHDDVKMNLAQRRKASLTFAKREGLQSALGIVVADEDDDARRAVSELYTPAQKEKIDALVKATNSDKEKLLSYLKIEDPEYMSRRDADKLIKALEHKRALSLEDKNV